MWSHWAESSRFSNKIFCWAAILSLASRSISCSSSRSFLFNVCFFFLIFFRQLVGVWGEINQIKKIVKLTIRGGKELHTKDDVCNFCNFVLVIKRKAFPYLNITNCSPKNRQIRWFLLLGHQRQLFFQLFETLFEMCPSIFLEFIVYLTSTRPEHTWTSLCSATRWWEEKLKKLTI